MGIWNKWWLCAMWGPIAWGIDAQMEDFTSQAARERVINALGRMDPEGRFHYLVQADLEGKYPLERAVEAKDLDLVEAFLAPLTAAQRVYVLELEDCRGNTPILSAFAQWNREMLRRLSEARYMEDKTRIVLPEVYRSSSEYGTRGVACMQAINMGDADFVTTLLTEAGEDRFRLLSHQNQYKDGQALQGKCGDSPLICAAENGNLVIVEQLLEGVSLEDKIKLLSQRNMFGDTALHVAAASGQNEIIDKLLEGLDVTQRGEFLRGKNHNGQTPLMLAASFGSLSAVSALLENIPLAKKKGLVEQADRDGYTLLMFAVLGENPEIIKMVLECVADKATLLQKQNALGNTALITAVMLGSVGAISALLKYVQNNKEVLCKLITQIQNNEGQNAWRLAEHNPEVKTALMPFWQSACEGA